MTRPSSAKTTADRKALRVRNSIMRSFRAMSQACERVSAIRRDRVAVRIRVRTEIDAAAAVKADEPATRHHRSVRRESEPLRKVVGDDDDRGACRAQLLKELRERPRA